MVLKLVKEHDSELSKDEEDQFFTLLTDYMDSTGSDFDVGRISKLIIRFL